MNKHLILSLCLLTSSFSTNNAATNHEQSAIDQVAQRQSKVVKHLNAAKDKIAKRADISASDKKALEAIVNNQIMAQDAAVQTMHRALVQKTPYDLTTTYEQLDQCETLSTSHDLTPSRMKNRE